MENFILLETAVTDASANQQYGTFMYIGMLLLMFLVMYFAVLRPQKKRQKQDEKMRSELQIGDVIVTIGGIVGKIVTVKEDSLIIESGVDRCRFQIKKWAVQTNTTLHDA